MHCRAFWDWSALLVLNVFTGDVKTAGTFLRPKGHSMFRFTIRDLLWLMVVVGLGIGWAVDHERLTGRYWPRLQQTSAAANKPVTPSGHHAVFFREIHIMDNWSMNKGELGKDVIEEWKQGYVRIETSKEGEAEKEDKFGRYLETRYVSTIHRNRTGEVITYPWSVRGGLPTIKPQPPTTTASPTSQ